MIKFCYGTIMGENSAPLKSECLPFVSVGSDLLPHIFQFTMSAEQNTQNLVYTGSLQRASYLCCSVSSFWFWFGCSDYFKTLHVFLYLFARKKYSIPRDCEEGAHNHEQHGRTWMRWHTKNTEFTGDEGPTATTLGSSYPCATPAGDGGGVGGRWFRFYLCL